MINFVKFCNKFFSLRYNIPQAAPDEILIEKSPEYIRGSKEEIEKISLGKNLF